MRKQSANINEMATAKNNKSDFFRAKIPVSLPVSQFTIQTPYKPGILGYTLLPFF